MEEAIQKILKNFVFVGGKIPHFEIEKLITPEIGRSMYTVTASMPKNHKSYYSEERAENIMENMETALTMLGFTGVNGQMIYKDGILYIRALGYYK